MALLLAAIVSVCFVSCKGSDEPEGPDSELVGTWEYKDSEGRETLTIKQNGTCVATATIYEYGETYSGSAKWSYKDGYLTIDPTDGSYEDERMVIQVVSVSKEELVFKDYPHPGNCVWKRI